MGAHGWSPPETDAMEVWQVARFLGEGDDTPKPILRGARMVEHPKDQTPGDPRTRRARDRKRPSSSRALTPAQRAKIHEERMTAPPTGPH